MLGAMWTVLNPILLMATYYFVFGVVLQARFGADPSRSGFVLYFLAGMIPWIAFSEAAGRAPATLWEYRSVVRKVVFPVEILPANLTIAGLVTQLFALLVFAVFLLITRGTIPATALWLPVLWIPQVLFTAGICWLLALLGVFIRDFGQITGYLLTLWFFLTPICYPEESLPESAMGILRHNPAYLLVSGYRNIFLDARFPDIAGLAELWIVSYVVLVLGFGWYYKLRRSFADIL